MPIEEFVPPSPMVCDCPGKEDGARWYGNSVRWLREEKRFVCGRTGLDPRPEAHGEMIADALPYMEALEDNNRIAEMLANFSSKLGRSFSKKMEKAILEAFETGRGEVILEAQDEEGSDA